MTPTELRDATLSAILAEAPAYDYGNVDPVLILAQAILETGHFASRLAREQNNMFGMRQPVQRPTVSTGAGPSGYATYATPRDSVRDYFMRQRYFNVPDNSDSVGYMNATIASGYNAHPDYIHRWSAVYSGLYGVESGGDGYFDPGGATSTASGAGSGASAGQSSTASSGAAILALFALMAASS